MTVTDVLRLNTLKPRQNGRHFADDIFKCIFLNENARISLHISLKLVPKVRIINTPALVQIMVWRRPGDKPLSEPMMVSLQTHICVTRPQWVNGQYTIYPIKCEQRFLWLYLEFIADILQTTYPLHFIPWTFSYFDFIFRDVFNVKLVIQHCCR